MPFTARQIGEVPVYDDASDESLYDVDELGVVDRSVVRGEQGAVTQEGVALAAHRPPRWTTTTAGHL